MFYINAEGLGEDFFAPHELMTDYDNVALETVQSIMGRPATERTIKFAWWIKETFIPLFNEANVEYLLSSSEGMISAYKPIGIDAIVHIEKQHVAPMNEICVTVGVLEDGTAANTLTTDKHKYRGKRTTDIRAEQLERDFFQAPEQHATAFHPRTKLHGATDEAGRIVYRAQLLGEGPERKYRKRFPILCPASELCIDPYSRKQRAG